MNSFYGSLTHTFVSLFSIVNPIGISPIFLNMTRHYPEKERNQLATKVALYGMLLLTVTLFIGPYILQFFGISLPYLQVAGGLIVFFTAWSMLTVQSRLEVAEANEARKTSDIAFFPLTMPLTAGAGSIAVTITLAGDLSQGIISHTENTVTEYIGVITGIFLVFACLRICFRFAPLLFKKLGQTGSNVVTRLSAFILLAIAIQIVWTGLKILIVSIYH